MKGSSGSSFPFLSFLYAAMHKASHFFLRFKILHWKLRLRLKEEL